MRKLLVLVLAVLLAGLSTSYAGKQDFVLVNKTGFDIHEVYVSPHSTDEWENDIIGKNILTDGASVEIKFSRTNKNKDWDLKVVDKAGKSIVWENLDLLTISKAVLRYTDGKATAEVE